jgi:hypothetical protein
MVRTNSEAFVGAFSRSGRDDHSKGLAITSIFQADERTQVEPVRFSDGSSLIFWLLASPLQARWQKALASVSLLLATTLVNIAPENPYLANTFQTWNPGQFLNFHGLTRLVSNLWPFLALPWLILMRTDHER